MFEWLIVSPFQFVIFSFVKKKCMMLEIVDKNVFKITALSNNVCLFAGFKTIILRSVYSVRFVK